MDVSTDPIVATPVTVNPIPISSIVLLCVYVFFGSLAPYFFRKTFKGAFLNWTVKSLPIIRSISFGAILYIFVVLRLFPTLGIFSDASPLAAFNGNNIVVGIYGFFYTLISNPRSFWSINTMVATYLILANFQYRMNPWSARLYEVSRIKEGDVDPKIGKSKLGRRSKNSSSDDDGSTSEPFSRKSKGSLEMTPMNMVHHVKGYRRVPSLSTKKSGSTTKDSTFDEDRVTRNLINLPEYAPKPGMPFLAAFSEMCWVVLPFVFGGITDGLWILEKSIVSPMNISFLVFSIHKLLESFLGVGFELVALHQKFIITLIGAVGYTLCLPLGYVSANYLMQQVSGSTYDYILYIFNGVALGSMYYLLRVILLPRIYIDIDIYPSYTNLYMIYFTVLVFYVIDRSLST